MVPADLLFSKSLRHILGRPTDPRGTPQRGPDLVTPELRVVALAQLWVALVSTLEVSSMGCGASVPATEDPSPKDAVPDPLSSLFKVQASDPERVSSNKLSKRARTDSLRQSKRSSRRASLGTEAPGYLKLS